MRSSRVCILTAMCLTAIHPSFGTENKKECEELFPLTQVRLTGGLLQAQQEQTRKYLLRLEPDRLLSRFRNEAGLEPKAKHYGGWEAPAKSYPDLAGHISSASTSPARR